MTKTLKPAKVVRATRIEDALAACVGEAWVIDTRAGAIIAATASGASRLGLACGRGGATILDGAMPGLARLRELVNRELVNSLSQTGECPTRVRHTGERLVFWTPSGSQALICDVTIPASGLASGPVSADEVGTILVEARGGRGERSVRPAATSAQDISEEMPEASLGMPAGMLGKLAHELKTPLSAISAASEIMKDERLGPIGNARYLGYAAGIHDSARHALGVIERLIGRGEANEGALEFAEIDANALLQSSASQVKLLAERAGIELALDLEPRLPHVVADATSLRQIVFNLLTNALKFTLAGGRITVASAYQLDGPLRIEVKDTGRGMSHREIRRYLDAKSAPRPERREGGGFGMGLPLVRALAEANGAQLAIESAPGKGTSAAVIFSKDRVIPV
ncbi:MAG: HAMP domain-containing sensor histidine kinase [Hyphomicrobium sp.]|jgi:signal transduction histidine kinase